MPDHRLRTELFEILRSDGRILELLETGSCDGIWFRDLERPDEEWSSPRCKLLLGYQEHEVPDSSAWWRERTDPEDLRRAEANFERHCEDPRCTYDQVVRLRHKDGSTVWVRRRGTALRDAAGHAVRMLGALTDLTEPKRVEQHLLRSVQELKRSNRELERFTLTCSHHLVEPARTITSLSQWIERTEGLTLTPEGRAQLAIVVATARRLLASVEDLLRYAHAGRNGLEISAVDLDAILTRVLASMATAVTETRCEVVRARLPVVQGDEALLEQLLQSLLSNAIKFHGSPPRLRVEAERGAECVVVRVRDQGPGVKPEFHERIFRIFERLHRPDDYPGTGVGLAFARRVVELHGGRIWAESNHGQGMTFSFSLPDAPGTRPPAGSPNLAGTLSA